MELHFHCFSLYLSEFCILGVFFVRPDQEVPSLEIFHFKSKLIKFVISLPSRGFLCSNLTIETLEQGVKYVQS